MKKAISSKFLALCALFVCMTILFTGCSTNTAGNSKGSGLGLSPDKPVRISIDEWIGYQNLVDANGGLTTAPDSINAKNGIYIEYIVMNNHVDSSNALITNQIVGAGYTVNRYSFLEAKFKEAGLDVVMPFITNYSNGGDGIIAKSDILSVEDLVGRKVGVPRYTESQVLVEWLLNNSSLSKAQQDMVRRDMVYFETADDAAKAFFAGDIDAAATWEPYLTQAASSTDSRVFFDTSMSTNLILSGVIFRRDFVENNEEFMMKFIDCAFQAAPMYKTVFTNIRQLPMFELMTDAEIIDMANGADLTNWTQNYQLLNDGAVVMYAEVANVWKGLGEVAYPERAKEAFTDKYILMLRDKYEGKETVTTSSSGFNESDKMMLIESPESLLSYEADIKFDLNSYNIRAESYPELDEFVKVAKVLNGVYIQIEGNASQRADGVSDAQIREFSKQRAQSIANYFIQHGIEEERIIIVGNGDSNPLNSENPAAAENRRTEIFFKTKMGY